MSSLISFIIVLGVLIFFHELGHFLIARLFGVGVEKFSLGFGPRLYGKKVGLTDYRLSAIPLGGYVKMIGEEPGSEIDPADIPLSFTHKPVYQRILIVAAGPLFNFLLAILLCYLLFQFSGYPMQVANVGDVKEGAPAFESGFLLRDRIVAIDGKPIEGWQAVEDRISNSEGKTLTFTVKRGQEELTLTVTPQATTFKNIFGEDVRNYSIGIRLYIPPVINDVVQGMPAGKAGLRKGDVIKAIDGESIQTWNALAQKVSEGDGRELDFKVLRDGDLLDFHITPDLQEEKDPLGHKAKHYRIGISSPAPESFKKSLNPIQAMAESVSTVYAISKFTVISMEKLITGKLSAKETLGGPILIAQTAGKMAREGLGQLMQFTAFISISLAILNFLPIPVLDGGHLLFFAIEAIRGRPVSVRVREIAQQAGMAILMLLMIFVVYNDILRIYTE